MATTQRKIVKTASRGIKGAALCISALAASHAYAAPRSINSCVTITKPGSYILDDDIIYGGSSNGTCITIMVSKVTIDLSGHTMSWPGHHGPADTATAIQSANDTEHVRVMNGTISSFGNGVQLFGSGSTVKNVTVGGPCPCEGVGIEAMGVVEDNVVNVASQLPYNSVGIHGAGVIKGNYIYNTKAYGMIVDANSTARGNTITGTVGIPGNGMYVHCPSTVAHNTITGSIGKNLVIDGEGCTVKDNTAP